MANKQESIAPNKNKLGIFSICLLGVNAIVGSGIFLLPGNVAKETGVWSIGVILFDAFLVLLIALCFAEAGGLFKKNGGPYVYAKEAFGEFVGFEVGFMKWAIMLIAWAAMAVAFYTALSNEFPILNSTLWKNTISIAMIVLLTIMNLLGVRVSKILNNVITLAKLLPLIFFVLAGIFYIKGSNFSFPIIFSFRTPAIVEGGFEVHEVITSLSLTGFGAGALLAFYAFTGFESIAVAAEDMERPERNVPLAIILVIACVSTFYLLILVVSIGILGQDLIRNPAIKAPIATAAGVFLGPVAKAIVSAGTLVSIGGINLASSFLVPRSSVALADDGFLPGFMKMRNKKEVPYISIIVSGLFTALICLTGSFTALLAISVISRFAQYIPTCLSIMVFRRRGMKSTFRIPLGWTVPILAVLVSLYLLANSDWKKILFGLGGLGVGAVLYIIMKLTTKKSS